MRTNIEQMKNNLGTKVEVSINVPKTISEAKLMLTPKEKKRLAKQKRISKRLVDFILNGDRRDTKNILKSAQTIVNSRGK